MLLKGNSYLRVITIPERKGLFAKGHNVYEVMTAPGVVEIVPAEQLAGVLGLDPSGPWGDLQECQRTARRLYLQGDYQCWVEYPTAIVVDGVSSEMDES